MKSPGVVYRRYRQLKRKLLYEKMIKARKTEFCNCHYGVTLDMFGDSFGHFSCVQICSYDYAPAKFDARKPFVCTCPKECNAYTSKWTKEKVLEQFEKELSDGDTKQRLYPELIALEWVLDKELDDATKNPTFIGKIIISTIVVLERLLRHITPRQKTIQQQ